MIENPSFDGPVTGDAATVASTGASATTAVIDSTGTTSATTADTATGTGTGTSGTAGTSGGPTSVDPATTSCGEGCTTGATTSAETGDIDKRTICGVPLGEITVGPGAVVGGVNTPSVERSPAISPDGLTLAFSSNRPGGLGDNDLYVATRPDLDSEFSTPQPLAGVNSPTNEAALHLSGDGLTIYLSSDRAGTLGGLDLWVSTRASVDDPFSTPESLGVLVNDAGSQRMPWVNDSGLRLVYTLAGLGELDDIVSSQRPNLNAQFSAPAIVLGADGESHERAPWLSEDLNTMFFASDREASEGLDLWYASRVGLPSDYEIVARLPIPSSQGVDTQPSLSEGECALYFASDRSGDLDLYRAEVTVEP